MNEPTPQAIDSPSARTFARRGGRVPGLLPVLALAATLVLPGLARAQSADMELVKTRIRQTLASGLASTATIQDYQATLQADGSWTDVDYASTAITNWPPKTHLDRLRSMAKVYAWGSPPGAAALRDDILKAYDAWITRDPQSANWWYQSISTPQQLGEILLLMGSDVSTARLTAGLTLIARAYVARATNSGTNTGANRVDRAYASMMRGLLANDSALTTESFLAMGDTILVNSANTFAEGIQADGSFEQHGAQFYLAGYGYGFVSGLLKYGGWGAGTAFGFSGLQQRVLLDHLLDGCQWVIRGNTMEYTASGRGLSRAGGASSALGFGSVLDDAVSTSGGYRTAELAAFRQRMRDVASAGQAVPASALTGNRNFWQADAMVHHRPGFSISVKTSSTRTLQPESGNGEGLKNLHLADGVTLIQRTGNEYDDLMPVWDWRRLPGTTIEQGSYSLKPSADWGVAGTSTHAGGVSNGTDGAAVFNYSRLGVAAKKSWFFFGNVMVALGTAINAPAATNPVLTTLNQTNLAGTVTYRTAGGSAVLAGTATPAGLTWVNHDHTGYFFPSAVANATVAGVAQTGSWQSINTSQSATAISTKVFSLQLNHGTAVSQGSYVYLVAPGVETAAMDSFPVANYRILQNDATIQAVSDLAAGKTAANFWAAGAVDGLSSDSKASVLLTRDSGFVELSVSDPTQTNAGSIVVGLATPVAGLIRADTGITVEQTSPSLRLRLATAKSYGRTFTARFFLRPNAFETLSFAPTADAFAYDGAASANFGSATYLTCKLITTSNSYTREAYLGFDLTGLQRTPVAASLRLSPIIVQTPGIHAVQPVGPGTWTETGLTWNNRPPPTGPATATWLPALSARTSCEVLSAVTGRTGNLLGLCVTTRAPTSDGLVNYASRESTDSTLRPTLELMVARPEIEIWRIEQFGNEATDPAVAGDAADPNGDGETNLLEFATAQVPLANTRAAIGLARDPLHPGDLTFTYPRNKAALADGIEFIVEWSDSLETGSWSHTGVSETIGADDGSIQTVNAAIPAAAAAQCFVRLRIHRS